MVDINRFIDETEKLSLLPDRLYLILKPVNDDKGGFDMMAYDTTDPKKSLSPGLKVALSVKLALNFWSVSDIFTLPNCSNFVYT